VPSVMRLPSGFSSVAPTLLAATMSASAPYNAARCGVLWDVDGTLVESTKLAFDATNEVLEKNGAAAVSVGDYKVGCKYTTPERFNFHLGLPEGSDEGARLGQIFDDTYVARVSKETAGLFPGMERLLRSISLNGHPQGALSNACGEYVRAVVAANELDEVPGQRMALFKCALGADEVPAAKPAADGLLICCESMSIDAASSVYVGDSPSDGKAARAAGMKSVGVLWGANPEAKLKDDFDVLVDDVPALILALREMLAPPKEEA